MRRQIWFVVLLVPSLLVAFSSPARIKGEDNLLKNGSIDSVRHWKSTSIQGAKFDLDKKEGGEKKGSLTIIKPVKDDTCHSWFQALSPLPDKPCNLKLIVKMKAEGLEAGSEVNVMVQCLDENGRFVGAGRCDPLSDDTDWVESSDVFLVPETCSRINVLAYFVGQGQAWFDDFRLFRTEEPVPKPIPGAPGKTESRLQELMRGSTENISWCFDAEKARNRARKEGKPILLYVRCTDDGKGYASALESIRAPDITWRDNGFKKDLLFRVGPLSYREMEELIERRFVPLCLTYKLSSHGQGNPDLEGIKDPLADLGLSGQDFVTPALAVLRRDGKLYRKIHRLGILSRDFIDRWLRHCLRGLKASSKSKEAVDLFHDGELERVTEQLDRNKDIASRLLKARALLRLGKLKETEKALLGVRHPGALALRGRIELLRGNWDKAAGFFRQSVKAGKEPVKEEATFYLGWCLARTGAREDACKAWKKIVGETCFGRKAAACLLEGAPRLMMAEVMRALPEFDEWPEQTEYAEPAPFDARRSLTILLELQREDGSFGDHGGPGGPGGTDAAITAIAADALWTWKSRVPQSLNRRMERAHKRALEFLDAWAKRPQSGNGKPFDNAYALMHLVRVGEKRTAKKIIGHIENTQHEDGNWTVYTPDRPASFNTALCIMALAQSKEKGYAIPKKCLERGVKALAAMRQPSGHFPYSTKPGHEWMTTDHGAIARNALCEHALLINGEGDRSGIDKALNFFLEYHEELRLPTKKLYDYFNPRGHGGYYFFFAHRNAIEAAAFADQKMKKKTYQAVRRAVLSASEFDGTFMDCYLLGRAYGTAMALWILAREE